MATTTTQQPREHFRRHIVQGQDFTIKTSTKDLTSKEKALRGLSLCTM